MTWPPIRTTNFAIALSTNCTMPHLSKKDTKCLGREDFSIPSLSLLSLVSPQFQHTLKKEVFYSLFKYLPSFFKMLHTGGMELNKCWLFPKLQYHTDIEIWGYWFGIPEHEKMPLFFMCTLLRDTQNRKKSLLVLIGWILGMEENSVCRMNHPGSPCLLQLHTALGLPALP